MGSPTDPAGSFDDATFLAAARELLTLPSDPAVQRFMRTFPLPSVLLALQSSSDPDVHVAALDALRCIVKSDVASGDLPLFLPSMEQGLFAPSEDVRAISCLAAQRISEVSRKVQATGGQVTPAMGILANKVILRGLLECLAGPTTSLATASADAIAAICSSSPGAVSSFLSEPTLSQFQHMLTHPPTEVQQRVIALSARLAAISDEAADVVKGLGVLETLMDMIGGHGYCRAAAEALAHGATFQEASSGARVTAPPDELAALTACELLTDFLQHRRTAALLSQCQFVHGGLSLLLARTANPREAASSARAGAGVVGMLVRAAWKAGACLVSPPTPGVPSPLTPQQAQEYAACLVKVCEALSPDEVAAVEGDVSMEGGGDAADVSADVDVANWEEAVSEAALIVSARVAGAELLLQPGSKAVPVHVSRSAFGALPRQDATSALQVAALHALASLLGSERGSEAHDNSNRVTAEMMPPVHSPPENVELSDSAEEQLREAVYYTAARARGGPTLGGVVHTLLKQEEPVRVAVYRLLAVLVERPWGLAEVCGNAAVLSALLDPLSETNKGAMDWRHTCVVAAASAAATHTTVSARGGQFTTIVSPEVVARLNDAAKLGPYAVRRVMEASPVVAVEERPPMGM